jgi:hypothetical protein
MFYGDEEDALFGESGVMVLVYDPEINRFKDDFGQVIDWIYKIIRPIQFMMFKKNKSNCIVRDVTNSFLVELVYPGWGGIKC